MSSEPAEVSSAVVRTAFPNSFTSLFISAPLPLYCRRNPGAVMVPVNAWLVAVVRTRGSQEMKKKEVCPQ